MPKHKDTLLWQGKNSLSLKQQAISGVKWTTMSTVVTTILQLLQLAILARILDPSVFGLMALVRVVIGFSQAFLDMGVSNAIIQKQAITKDQLSTLYWVNVVAGFLLFLIIALIAPFVAEFYNEPELTELIFIVGLTFIIQPFGQQFMVLWQKEMRFSEIAKIAIVNNVISLIVSVYLAYKGYGVYALVFGALAGMVSQTAQFMYKGLREYRPGFIFKIKEIKEFLSFGAYQMGEISINYISANIDKILIGKFIGMEALGFYNLAWQLILFPLTKINPTVNKVAFPLYAKLQYEPIRLSNLYTKSLSALFIITVPLLVFMFFYASEIVYVAYGAGWETTANLISILAIIGILKAAGNPSGALILAIGRADVGFWWNLGYALTVSLAMYATMLISQDLMVVAYVLLGIALFTTFIYHKIVQTVSHVRYKQLVINFFKILLIAIFTGIISYAVVHMLHVDNIILRTIIGGIVYLLLYGMYLKKCEMEAIDIFLSTKVRNE